MPFRIDKELTSDELVVRRFYGHVGLNELSDSWNEVFSLYKKGSYPKKYLCDYTTCQLTITHQELGAFVNLLRNLEGHLSDIRMAILIGTPEHATIFVLAAMQVKDLNIFKEVKEFSTESAALKWLNKVM